VQRQGCAMVVASSAAVSAAGRISPGAQLDVSVVGDIARIDSRL